MFTLNYFLNLEVCTDNRPGTSMRLPFGVLQVSTRLVFNIQIERNKFKSYPGWSILNVNLHSTKLEKKLFFIFHVQFRLKGLVTVWHTK